MRTIGLLALSALTITAAAAERSAQTYKTVGNRAPPKVSYQANPSLTLHFKTF